MSRERAEAYLRLLAEEELRRPVGPRRVRWAAELLIAMGALDDEVADRIVADFDLALLARQAFPTRAGRAARLQRWSAGVRFWPAVPVSSGSPAAMRAWLDRLPSTWSYTHPEPATCVGRAQSAAPGELSRKPGQTVSVRIDPVRPAEQMAYWGITCGLAARSAIPGS
jgi:hypothetical protein